MDYYRQKAETVLETVRSSGDGLSSAEAERRLAANGKNRLKESKKPSPLRMFLKELGNPMIIVLLAAALVSFATAVMAGESFADTIIILIVVIINGILGVYQEKKAEKAIEALQEMAAATSRVLRDGHPVTVRSEELVVGDVIIIEAGDAIPADGRVIECASLQIEEAALTGESVPSDKLAGGIGEDGAAVPLGDRKNMVYMGGTAVYGRGRAVITAVGMDTEMGRIADALTKAEEGQTPLQKKLSQLSRILSWLVIGICLFIFAFDIVRSLIIDGSVSGEGMLDTFMIAVSLAVAAIPEGLAAVVTIVLSIGVTKMSKHNAIIRKLTAVETLGCAQVICSDKTGTLTQNKMTVTESYPKNGALLAKAMALCSDAEQVEGGGTVGEPTECALVNFAASLGLTKRGLEAGEPRIGEAPFDSMRKLMTTVHRGADGVIAYTKGAPDELLKRCTAYFEDGVEKPLDGVERARLLEINGEYASKALRVLAAAYRKFPDAPASYEPDMLEHELVFIGFTGMIDPVRPEVRSAIDECRSAGIRPVMITGDHIDTAVAIAKELGIISDRSQAITGAQLDSLTDEELTERIENYGVYARVQPEHKVRIVSAWRAHGFVVAMTGDGVNDAPSIKAADIGVGMGITGTDVTKNVADMVLADDNFATIVGAVGEGRRIYDNIRKSIQFLLASNMSEVLGIFVATLLGFTLLKPVHLLWINLITDCFPALALGMERAERNVMSRPPRSGSEGIFSGGMGVDIAYQGIAVTLLTLGAYFIGHFMEAGTLAGYSVSPDGMTMAFLTMSMAEIFHAFNMRSRTQSIFTLKGQNVWLWGAGIVSLIMTTVVIYVPFLRSAFEFEHISVTEYAVALALAAAIIPIAEIGKAVRRYAEKRKTETKAAA